MIAAINAALAKYPTVTAAAKALGTIAAAIRARMPGCDTDRDVEHEGRRWTVRIVVMGRNGRPVGKHEMRGPTQGAAVAALARSLGVDLTSQAVASNQNLNCRRRSNSA